jgi:hypothetical protein
MTLEVGSAVARRGKPHGVIMKIGAADATVAWHLKEASLSLREGTPTGRATETLAELVSDSLCPYCKEFLTPVK